MLAGELYDASDPQLIAERIHAKTVMHRMNVTEYDISHGERHAKNMQVLLPNCPADMYIEPPFFCDYGYNIYAKEKVYFNHNVLILDVTPVYIGARTLVGPGVQMYAATHPMDFKTRGEMLESGKSITIGDDCWIGGSAVLCPGVTIGDRCVIGAGSVVTKDIPSDSVAVGNPARVIRKL